MLHCSDSVVESQIEEIMDRYKKVCKLKDQFCEAMSWRSALQFKIRHLFLSQWIPSDL